MAFRNSYQSAQLIVLVILLLVFGWSTWAFLANSFPEVVGILSMGDSAEYIRNSDVNNMLLKRCYTLLKLVSFAGLFYVAYAFCRVIAGKYDTDKRRNPLYRYVASVIDNNIAFLSGLGVTMRTLLLLLILVRGIIMVYYMFNMPYHYDETLNYRLFSGKGVLTSLVAYTLPNNHIFHSAVSAFLIQLLPWDPYWSMRLPNVVASIISIYYFFKLQSLVLNDRASFLGTGLFAFSYSFFIYSIHARGYAFTILFTILALYAFANILREQHIRKYLVLYVISIVLGCFTIPTFIYVAVPASIVLFGFYLHRRRIFILKEFFLCHVLIAILTALCYAPMLLTLGTDAFEKAQKAGITPFEFNEANIWSHLTNTWQYLAQELLSPYAGAAILVIAVVYLFLRKALLNKYFAILILFIAVSPYPLILAQGSIPFPRNWTYMIIPLSFCIAAVADLIFSFEAVNNRVDTTAVLAGIAAIVFIILCDRSIATYKTGYEVDQKVKGFVSIIKPKLPYINTIGRGPGFAWYISETIDSEGMKENKYYITTGIQQGDTSINQDLIITDKSQPVQVPATHHRIPYDNPHFDLYLKEGL